MDFYRRVQSEEKGLCHSGELGGVVHVDDEVPSSGAIHVREVRRLRLEFIHYGLKVSMETSVLNGRVGLLRRHAETEHEAHILSSFLPLNALSGIDPFHR